MFALVGSGASVNVVDQRGCSPLHYAAAADTEGKWVLPPASGRVLNDVSVHAVSLCSVRCVEYLLRNGADPGVNDKQGYCAVHYASAYGRTLCLELVGALSRIYFR